MYSTSILLGALTSLVVAQDTTFKPATGVRSLWIPFQTISGTPLASIMTTYNTTDSVGNITEYVLSCPTATPQCALAPNLTLTEGVGSAKYVTSNTGGAATIACTYSGTETATCSQGILDAQSNIMRTETTISGSMISFQAVQVTATMNATSSTTSGAGAAGKTSSGASGSATATSSAGVAGQSSVAAPWAMGGVLGAGLMAVVAL